jgi:hypothetical protein
MLAERILALPSALSALGVIIPQALFDESLNAPVFISLVSNHDLFEVSSLAGLKDGEKTGLTG